MNKLKPKVLVINSLDKSMKKDFSTSIVLLIFDKHIVNITMIGIDIYCIAYKFKRAQVFIVFIKDLEF